MNETLHFFLTSGMAIDLPSLKSRLVIEPLTLFQATDRGVMLPAGNPDWNTGYGLAETAWVYQALLPGSLRLHSRNTIFEENKDYVVDYHWGRICRTATSSIPDDATCDIDYRYTQARVDLVQVNDKGTVTIKKGREHKKTPEIPQPDPHATPLFTVYLPHSTQKLSESNLLIIDPSTPAGTPFMNAHRLQPFRTKLVSGSPVKVVCFGDSITQGEDAGDDRYVFRLQRYFNQHYPGKVDVINTGVGGNTSRDGLARLDQDVLRHHPDLVVIMFGVNDENARPAGNDVPVAEYRANLQRMVDTIRTQTHACVILMTTSWKNLGWEFTKGNLNEYADTIRTLGKQASVCVIDNFQAWGNLSKRGIPYMNLLDSCINHPNGPAHEIFINGLIGALEEPGQANGASRG